ncbi:hypothetical protein YWIDRAFT_08411 [Streptomyces sp. SceaMP-e96]|nr:hypothetical protein YWIDRAFT_08411 [Streptomyces sp. SceaMP-e96]
MLSLCHAGCDSGVEECGFECVERVACLVCEGFFCAGESGAAVESSGVAVEFLPAGGVAGELAVQADAVAFVGDPAVEPGPGGDQCFVCETDVSVVEGEQPAVGEAVENRVGLGLCLFGAGLGGSEFGAGGGAVGVLGAVSRRDEAEQDVAGEGGLGWGELMVGVFGGAGDGAVQSASGFISLGGQRPSSPAAPGFHQSMGHQRQGAGFVPDVLDDAGGQVPFNDQSTGHGRPHDGCP